MKSRLFSAAVALGLLAATGRQGSAQEQFPFQIFERYLESLIPQIGMPGLSAIIVQNQRTVWFKNYGFADVERQIRTTSDTPYPIGGVTQAFTGVLTGVCIDRFRIDDLDQLDIRRYVPTFPEAGTSVRQVLAHATDGRFRYDPSRYSALTQVVESKDCFRQNFRQAMAAEVLNKLALTRSVPGLDLALADGSAARALFDDASVQRYQRVLGDVAVPYRLDAKGRSFRSEYPSFGLDASNGLVSTANDLAKFYIALEESRFSAVPLSRSTLEKMWSNTSFTFNRPPPQPPTTIVMPTGLGWFVTTESGQRLVWTFGHIPDAGSALIVSLTCPPEVAGVTSTCVDRRLTLILVANSDGLVRGYNLENATVTASPFVKVFLRLFI
jgi:CubicO group peptidase (beta-lactamase class C family)